MEMRAVALGNSEFGRSLYDVVRKSAEGGGNFVMSPYSASSVMAMATTGAMRKTLTEMREKMKFPAEQEMLSGYRSAFGLLSGNDNFTLETANKVYVQDGYQLVKAFTEIVGKYFNAEPTPTNFAASEEARKMINGWVEEQTGEKIKDLIPQGVLNSLTRLVLVNAIYFKERMTNEEEFFVSETKTVTAKLMNQELEVKTASLDDLDADVVELPYKGDRLAMYIVLPKQRHGLGEVEDKMSTKNFNDIFKEVKRSKKLNIFLPKFKLEQTLRLTEHFKKP